MIAYSIVMLPIAIIASLFSEVAVKSTSITKHQMSNYKLYKVVEVLLRHKDLSKNLDLVMDAALLIVKYRLSKDGFNYEMLEKKMGKAFEPILDIDDSYTSNQVEVSLYQSEIELEKFRAFIKRKVGKC